jgi:hypothetical protein
MYYLNARIEKLEKKSNFPLFHPLFIHSGSEVTVSRFSNLILKQYTSMHGNTEYIFDPQNETPQERLPHPTGEHHSPPLLGEGGFENIGHLLRPDNTPILKERGFPLPPFELCSNSSVKKH